MSPLPLDRLIDCIADNNLQALIIEGSPPEQELKQAWDAIYDDFIGKMQDDDGRFTASLVVELNLLRTNINAVETIVKFLEWLFSAGIEIDTTDLAGKLQAYLGFPVKFDQSDKNQCTRVLEMVLATAKRWYVDAEGIKMQINSTIAGQDNHAQIDREYFDHILVALSINQKFKVNARETATGEFIVMVHMLRQRIDSLDQQNYN